MLTVICHYCIVGNTSILFYHNFAKSTWIDRCEGHFCKSIIPADYKDHRGIQNSVILPGYHSVSVKYTMLWIKMQ